MDLEDFYSEVKMPTPVELHEVKIDLFEPTPRAGSGSNSKHSSSSMERLRVLDKNTPRSPSLERRRIEQELAIKHERYENEYSTCCTKSGKTDKRLILFTSKFGMSLLILGFAGYQIMGAGECDGLLPWYTSLITLIVSVWVKPTTNTSQKPNGAAQ